MLAAIRDLQEQVFGSKENSDFDLQVPPKVDLEKQITYSKMKLRATRETQALEIEAKQPVN